MWPALIYLLFKLLEYATSQVAACLPFIDVHNGIFTYMLIACMFMFRPMISWSLFPVWLFQDNQSANYRSGPGLYKSVPYIGECAT